MISTSNFRNFTGKKTVDKEKLLTYQELLEEEPGEYKMKSKEQLSAEGFSFVCTIKRKF